MAEEGIKLDKRGLILILGLALIYFWFNQAPSQTKELSDPAEPRLIIAKLSISVPIIFVESPEENLIQQGLQRGVAHLAGTAEPGEFGNCYIVGHSSDYPNNRGNYKAVFAALPQLQIGDEVVISESEQDFIYAVIETKVVEADDLTVLSQETGGQKLLTLQTSYPIGTAKQRFLVIAKFVEK